MSEILSAKLKEKIGKGSARELRRNGWIPCILYGDNKDQTMLSLPLKSAKNLCMREDFYNNVVEISIDEKPAIVALPKAAQLHPVTGDPLHLDFLRVGKGSRVKIRVPVEFINSDKSQAIKLGGVLNIVINFVEVLCSPVSIPKKFEIDLSNACFGRTFTVSDLNIPSDCKLPHNLHDSSVVATIVQPQGEESGTSAEETAAPGAAN